MVLANGSDPDNRYVLTGGNANTTNGYETIIQLTNTDLNEITEEDRTCYLYQ